MHGPPPHGYGSTPPPVPGGWSGPPGTNGGMPPPNQSFFSRHPMLLVFALVSVVVFVFFVILAVPAAMAVYARIQAGALAE